MKSPEETLAAVGLTDTEAKIYLAGLTNTTVTVQTLAQKTKIKRPTIYHAIANLIEKGLVAEKKSGNKSVFSMSSPDYLKTLVEQQKTELDENDKAIRDIIPFLKQQQKAGKTDDTSIVQYHGIEGMKTVMDIAFFCKSRHWDIIAPIQNFIREYSQEYAKKYLHTRKKYAITSRTLWEFKSDGRDLTDEEIKERNPRFMPAAMQGKFKSMIILFDDKIALFSSYDKPGAILITSKEQSKMFAAIFESLWEFSERYK